MPYKIAVATSDGVNIDRTFGSAECFTIYEVNDDHFTFAEKRAFPEWQEISPETCKNDCHSGCGNGCGNGGQHSGKVDLISDCRCVVCTKIGFPIRKQLGRVDTKPKTHLFGRILRILRRENLPGDSPPAFSLLVCAEILLKNLRFILVSTRPRKTGSFGL